MSFYLNGKYVSDSYLRYKLLNNNKVPNQNEEIQNNNINNSAEEITEEYRILLDKLGLEVTETDTDGLLNRLEDIITRNNINQYSSLSAFTQSHLIAILYLLYEGRINEEDIRRIISSSTFKGRTEILLSFLNEPATTEFVDLFKPLKNISAKMTNYLNPGEKEPTAAMKVRNNLKSKKLNLKEQRLYYGNYYYADKGANSQFQYCNTWRDGWDFTGMPIFGKGYDILKDNTFRESDFKITGTWVWNYILDSRITLSNWKFKLSTPYTNFVSRTGLGRISEDRFKHDIDVGYGVREFLDYELNTYSYYHSYYNFWWSIWYGLKEWRILCNNTHGYKMTVSDTSPENQVKIRLDDMFAEVLCSTALKMSEYDFEKRAVINFPKRNYNSEISEFLKIGYKKEFDKFLIDNNVPELKFTTVFKKTYVEKFPTKENSLTNPFDSIKHSSGKSYFKPISNFINGKYPELDTEDVTADINSNLLDESESKKFLSYFIKVEDSTQKLCHAIGEQLKKVGDIFSGEDVFELLGNEILDTYPSSYVHNSAYQKVIDDIMKMDFLIDSNKNIINFGHTNIYNKIIEITNEISNGLNLITVDLINKNDQIQRELIERYNNISNKSGSFYETVTFLIAYEIVGNYLIYLFPEINGPTGLKSFSFRESTNEEFTRINDVFNITNNNDDGSDNSLFGLYKRVFKVRHFILRIDDAVKDIKNNEIYKRIVNDPCNCNKLFDGMSNYANYLRYNTYFQQVFGTSRLTYSNIQTFKPTLNGIGGIL